MDESFEYIIQAAKLIQSGGYKDDELEFVHHLVLAIDNETLIIYHNSCNLIGYENDLDLYHDLLRALIMLFEESEEYEKCKSLYDRIGEINTIKETNSTLP